MFTFCSNENVTKKGYTNFNYRFKCVLWQIIDVITPSVHVMSPVTFRELSQMDHFYLMLWSVMKLTLGEIDALIEW